MYGISITNKATVSVKGVSFMYAEAYFKPINHLEPTACLRQRYA